MPPSSSTLTRTEAPTVSSGELKGWAMAGSRSDTTPQGKTERTSGCCSQSSRGAGKERQGSSRHITHPPAQPGCRSASALWWTRPACTAWGVAARACRAGRCKGRSSRFPTSPSCWSARACTRARETARCSSVGAPSSSAAPTGTTSRLWSARQGGQVTWQSSSPRRGLVLCSRVFRSGTVGTRRGGRCRSGSLRRSGCPR
mmetsp:Transcript_37920/g.77830  ORF Transcript_37920/g.77830 Transcript_37920/m.77830 type:complete len:201 (+) Transcript_37920:445-1047(+)